MASPKEKATVPRAKKMPNTLSFLFPTILYDASPASPFLTAVNRGTNTKTRPLQLVRAAPHKTKNLILVKWIINFV